MRIEDPRSAMVDQIFLSILDVPDTWRGGR